LTTTVSPSAKCSQPEKVSCGRGETKYDELASYPGGIPALQVAVLFEVLQKFQTFFFRFTELDGKHIDHLDYHEIYNPQNTSQSSAEEMEEQKKHSARQDEFILKHLFRKTG